MVAGSSREIGGGMTSTEADGTEERPRCRAMSPLRGVSGCVAMMLVVVTAVVGPHACGGYVPPTFTGTGPYRRVYSATGASYLSVSVFLPGSSQVTMSGSDTAYVYVGGWGANGAGAVDAGFQYSPTFNNWSLFAAGVGVGRVNYGTSATRMAANQTVQLSFAVTQSGTNVTLTVQATGTQINNAGLVTQSVALANVAGWSPGGQNTLKRMTSIAQVGGDNFTSGSRIAGVVSVQYTNAANEIDAINLVAVPEPAVAWFATPLVAGLAWSGRGRRDRLIPQMPSHEPRE